MHPRFCGQRSPWCRSTRNASPAMFPEMDLMGVEPIAPILQRSAASSGIQAREQGRGLWHTPHSVLPAEAEGLEPSSEQLATCFQDRLLIRPVDFPMRTAWDPFPQGIHLPGASVPRLRKGDGARTHPAERRTACGSRRPTAVSGERRAAGRSGSGETAEFFWRTESGGSASTVPGPSRRGCGAGPVRGASSAKKN